MGRLSFKKISRDEKQKADEPANEGADAPERLYYALLASLPISE